MRWSRNAQLSCEILAAHKLRSVLSTLGIIVGVAAVILMVSIGRGAEKKLLSRVRAMGTDLVIVNAAPARRMAGRAITSEIVTTLTPADATALAEENPYVIAAAPVVNKSMLTRWEANNVTTTITGTTPAGLRMRNLALHTGRVFDEIENRGHRRVAILGAGVAQSLFAGTDPIAQTIRIGRVPFEVIGVMKQRGIDVNGTDQDDVIFIPLHTAMRRVLNSNYVHAIYLQAVDSNALSAVENETRNILRRRQRLAEGGADAFVILNQARLVATERGTARAMTHLIGSLAGIALLLGGLGIFAVMLISVRERMVEIGLRRALGARCRDICSQFLVEAALLASVGGFIGALCGVGLTWAADVLGVFDAVLSWPAVLTGLLSSMGAGLLFGTYPALRAARLEPIEALRIS
jgi:putative ABC transport system permease protein